ncbi:hypothetical protein [Chitinophaga niabensis]|uniref:Uncharacterized protein n=1 Tax=Chitinophaga niabensis TaxID=536979 RepID=A0A1N6F4H4_9BACT|nr:hypothetical protein [Chitinophaga niabensis]SIN90161.1 hypothetical protein SAMN04488055_2010 [Chitinophaga niabensis]
MKHFLCTALLLASLIAMSCSASRKSTAAARQAATNTSWIQMMDDPNVNYFEAVKVFEAYWQGKPKPTSEHELFSAEDKDHALNNSSYSNTRDAEDPSVKYRFEYKKFLHWKEEVAPYVQPNGRILTAEERIDIWKQQKGLRQ